MLSNPDEVKGFSRASLALAIGKISTKPTSINGQCVTVNRPLDNDKAFEIVLSRSEFRSAVRELLTNSNRVCIAEVRHRTTVTSHELVIEAWKVVDAIPDAAKLPPLASFALMISSGNFARPSVNLGTTTKVERSQSLVGIVVEPEKIDSLDVSIFENGEHYKPTAIRFIGARLATARTDFTPNKLSESVSKSTRRAARRQSRLHGALKEDLASRIHRKRLLVVGAGAGASSLARELASLCPEQLVIIDDDLIGFENLNNLLHATEDDAKKRLPKVDILVKALHGNHSGCRLLGLRHRINDRPAIDFFKQHRFDTVFSFVDNDAARLATNILCRTTNTVHVDLGTLIEFENQNRVSRGDVRLLEPGRGNGCIACVPEMRDLQDVFYEIARPKGALRRGLYREWNELRAGSLCGLNNMIASLAVDLWLQYIAGLKASSHWLRLHWRFGGTPTIEGANVNGSTKCRLCAR